jgi:hypothetical protein
MKKKLWRIAFFAILIAIALQAGCDISENNEGSPPPVPTNFAVILTDNEPVLHWVSSEEETQGVYVERADAADSVFSRIANVNQTGPASLIDSEAVPETSYNYRIAAYNDYGTSDWAASVDTVTPLSEAEIEVRDVGDNVLTNDQSEINMGTYVIGEATDVYAFPVKNIGTSTLRISSGIEVTPANLLTKLFIS